LVTQIGKDQDLVKRHAELAVALRRRLHVDGVRDTGQGGNGQVTLCGRIQEKILLSITEMGHGSVESVLNDFRLSNSTKTKVRLVVTVHNVNCVVAKKYLTGITETKTNVNLKHANVAKIIPTRYERVISTDIAVTDQSV
jgi:hypothetical protein